MALTVPSARVAVPGTTVGTAALRGHTEDPAAGGTRREVPAGSRARLAPGGAGKAAGQSCPGHAALRVRGGLAPAASSHGLPLPMGLAAGGVFK